MKLTHFFIDRLALRDGAQRFYHVDLGLAAMIGLPAQYPNIVPPTIQITTNYPGASADTIARTVATPLEQAVNGVENMDYITSQSTRRWSSHHYAVIFQDRRRSQYRA